MMDFASVNVVLLDERVSNDRFESGVCASSTEPKELLDDIRSLLTVFKGVHILGTGSACLAKARLLDSIATDCSPIFVLLPVTADLIRGTNIGSARSSHLYGATSSSPSNIGPSELSRASGDEDIYGLALLKHINLEISESHFSRLIVPIAVIEPDRLLGSRESSHYGVANGVNPVHAIKCIEIGASDVISSPIVPNRLPAMSTLAYRAHIEGTKARPKFLELKKSRKLSWVGVDEEKPYAYLREVMVSTLMSSICKPEVAVSKPAQSHPYKISPSREKFITEVIGTWAFPAHDLADDELVHAGYLMLQHALNMPELEQWRLSSDDLKQFVIACRSAYNSFVLYHNFRHVIDVLQAIFCSLLHIGTLPPYPPTPDNKRREPRSPIAALLGPFEAFVLLVTAIGHDVGHPGVNNAFLVALKAPLAQLYNDTSVLEAFHCAAYSQILRRFWPSAYEDTKVRSLLIKSILATDMQLHFKYMTDLGNLQEKLAHNEGTDGWSVKDLEEYKILTCGLLIKCADISNAARPFHIAARWSDILQLEFARQGEMEQGVGIETTLAGGPPELGNITKLANSQIGFMNIFARPLFEGVADILPSMKFAGDQVRANQDVWRQKIEEEKNKKEARREAEQYAREGFHSPRSGSPDRFFSASEQSHPEGLPGTGAKLIAPHSPPMSTSQGTVDSQGKSPSTSPPAANTSTSSNLPSSDPSQNSVSTQQGLASAPSNPGNVFSPSSTTSSSAPPSADLDSPPLFHASSPTTSQPLYSPTAATSNGARTSTGATTGPATNPATYSSNFSRPMSHRHSANTSFARSSAPSGTPTVASTFLPTSPTGTQATSLFEGSGYSADGEDRPGTGDSASLVPSSLRSPRGDETKLLSSASTAVNMNMSENERRTRANGHVGSLRVGGRDGGSVGEPMSSALGSGGGIGRERERDRDRDRDRERTGQGGEREVRRKGSRFRFDFWKKKKATGGVNAGGAGTSSSAGTGTSSGASPGAGEISP